MKKIAWIILVCIGLCVSALTIQAKPRQKIGMRRATAIARTHARGTLKSKELEKEKGRWIYSFEFADGKGRIREVNIDAYSGKVVGIEHEDAKKEGTEEKMDGKPKH